MPPPTLCTPVYVPSHSKPRASQDRAVPLRLALDTGRKSLTCFPQLMLKGLAVGFYAKVPAQGWRLMVRAALLLVTEASRLILGPCPEPT